MTTAEQTFRSKSSGIVAKLLGDFPIRSEDAFAIVGNGGHESNGFSTLQEIKPVVPGSRGGWGWFQWTGPRRKAFEAYCRRNNLDPASDAANYAWLFVELKGSEARAIRAVLDADGQYVKVEAFERAFLRAGVKHYDRRLHWARIAQSQWAIDGQAPAPTPIRRKQEMLEDEATATAGRAKRQSRTSDGLGGGGLVTGGASQVDGGQVADLFLVGIGVGLVAIAIWLAFGAWKKRQAARRLRIAANQLAVMPAGAAGNA